MKFLICEVPQEYTNDGDYYTGTDGREYYYEVNYVENEYVNISDTCGRMIPLDITEVADLASMLGRIVQHHNRKQEAEAYFMAKLLDGVSQ